MKKRSKTIFYSSLFLCAVLSMTACGGNGNSGVVDVANELSAFKDHEEFKNYLVNVSENAKKLEESNASSGSSPLNASPPETSMSQPAFSNNTNITNNQEPGVDEGDIVKNYRNLLITLRHGNLYSVRVNSDRTLTKIDQKSVMAEGLSNAVWYDELLLRNNHLIVIGYRYRITEAENSPRAFTEINFFKIEDNGLLVRSNTYFIHSSDYYSYSNYTGRQIGDQLVFYMPYFYRDFLVSDTRNLQLPKVYRYQGAGNLEEMNPLLSVQDIYKPLQSFTYPYLHTLVRCNLTQAPQLQCKGRGVIASYEHQYYVSPNRLYLWTQGEELKTVSYGSGTYTYPQSSPKALLYSMDLQSGEAGVLKTHGFIPSQFAFSEKGGILSVFAQERDEASSCLSQQNSSNFLLQIPLSNLRRQALEADGSFYRCLPNHAASVVRFHPEYLAFGGDDSYTLLNRQDGSQVTLPIREGSLSRIELAGDKMIVVIQNHANSLTFNLIDFPNRGIRVADTYTQEDTSEAESRSHAFFYDAASQLFALATYRQNLNNFSTDYGLHGSSQLHFFKLTDSRIRIAGNMNLNASLSQNNACTISCVDWYGNTRPIFLNGSLLGLLGNQMSVGIWNDHTQEVETWMDLDLASGETHSSRYFLY